MFAPFPLSGTRITREHSVEFSAEAEHFRGESAICCPFFGMRVTDTRHCPNPGVQAHF
jgi:hypothetical protein